MLCEDVWVQGTTDLNYYDYYFSGKISNKKTLASRFLKHYSAL